MAENFDIFMMLVFLMLVVLLAALVERLYRENEALRADGARAVARHNELVRRLERVERAARLELE